MRWSGDEERLPGGWLPMLLVALIVWVLGWVVWLALTAPAPEFDLDDPVGVTSVYLHPPTATTRPLEIITP